MNTSDIHSLPKHWLAIRLGHLGDVALCTGVLERLAAELDWKFSFVTKREWAPLFEHSPCVGEVVALGPETLRTAAFAAWRRSLAREREGWGLLDLNGNLRSRLLSLAWKGPVLRYPKMGFARRVFLRSGGRFWGGRLREFTVPQRYYMAVAAPPPPARELLPRIYLAPAEEDRATRLLTELFGPGARPVALHPYAAHERKTWSPERWREMAALLDARGMAWVAIGQDRRPSPFAGQANDLSNKLSLRESCALLSRCRALVSGDSGPMHLATGVGTPVVALFGPTTREWGFFPSGPRDTVLELPLACRPCSLHGKSGCAGEGRCLADIGAERVLKAVEEVAPTGYMNGMSSS